MKQLPNNRDPRKGDQFVHPTGVTENVYCVMDDRVLTFREYPSTEHANAALSEASYDGVDPELSQLPSPLEIHRAGSVSAALEDEDDD